MKFQNNFVHNCWNVIKNKTEICLNYINQKKELNKFQVVKYKFLRRSVLNHYPSVLLPNYENVFDRVSYLSSLNFRNRIPNWVAEKLSDIGIISETKQRPKFIDEKCVPESFRAVNDDYFDSGYSRGHLAAAGNHKHDSTFYDNTFLLNSNILPQNISNNATDWYRLENLAKRFKLNCDDVYVISGPAWLPNHADIKNNFELKDKKYKVEYEIVGKTLIAVPTHLWKIIIAVNPKAPHLRIETPYLPQIENIDKMGSIGVAAFIMKNDFYETTVPLQTFQIKLDLLSKYTGLNFKGLENFCLTKKGGTKRSLQENNLCNDNRCDDMKLVLNDSRLQASRLLGSLDKCRNYQELMKMQTTVENLSDKFLTNMYKKKLESFAQSK